MHGKEVFMELLVRIKTEDNELLRTAAELAENAAVLHSETSHLKELTFTPTSRPDTGEMLLTLNKEKFDEALAVVKEKLEVYQKSLEAVEKLANM